MKSKEIFYDTSYQAVDLIIHDKDKFLLGRKKAEKEFRFIGGIVDPVLDNSLEMAAVREKNEEIGIGLECSFPIYSFSFRVDDPRYRESRHKIMSAVFFVNYVFGRPKELQETDEIVETKWFSKIELIQKDKVVKEHFPIVDYIEKYI